MWCANPIVSRDRMNTTSFDWNRFHAYRGFDEFLGLFILQRKSYATRHPDALDLAAAFEDIRERFVATFGDSEAHFEEKVISRRAAFSPTHLPPHKKEVLCFSTAGDTF